jgi:hypothetical protein
LADIFYHKIEKPAVSLLKLRVMANWIFGVPVQIPLNENRGL